MQSLLIPFGSALILAYVLTPLVIRGAHKAGILDVPRDERRAHSMPVPRLGGVAICLAILLAWLGQYLASGTAWNSFGPKFQELAPALAIGSGFIFFVGILDDVRGVSPRLKLIFQTCAALSIVAFGVAPDTIAFIPGTGVWAIGKLAGTCLFVFWIVGVTNAFNLIDGLDGLASSFALVALGVAMLSIASMNTGLSPVAPAILAGAVIGFLKFNWHPARVFLGDAGSMTLGFLLAVLTVNSATDLNGVTYPIIPLLALGFPITDTFVAMARRWVRGVPFSLADGRHIHHQLRTTGLSVPTTVRALVIAFSLLSIFGLTVVFAPPRFALGIIAGGVPLIVAGTVHALRWLRYDELGDFISSTVLLFRQARQTVQVNVHISEAANCVRTASSIDDIKSVLDRLTEGVGLLDIELIGATAKDSTTPPSQQIARLESQPMRLDYSVLLPGNSMNKKIIIRFWCGVREDHHIPVMERVATRIGPAVGKWLSAHSADLDFHVPAQKQKSIP